MAALTGLYISSSYGGVIHLSTNTGITTGSATQLQDGFGTNLGVWLNGQGNVSASTFTGLASNATSASYSNTATSASYSLTATSASYAVNATSASYSLNATSASYALNATTASYSLNATSASYALNATSASYAVNATSASYALNATSASYASLAANSILLNGTASSVFATTGSNTFVGNQTISGSVKGKVTALTITSQTASLDWNTGNYFTLTLVSGSTTRLNFSNTQAGEVINLQIQQSSISGGNLSFPSTVTFPTGSAYTASIAANEIDLLTLISFDGTNVRAVPAKQFQ